MHLKIFLYCFLNMAGNKESILGAQDPEKELTCVMLETIVMLLKGSVRNAGKDGTKLALSVLEKTLPIFSDLCQCPKFMSKDAPALTCG